MLQTNRSLGGFTLIELLIVIAIVSTLAVVSFVALAPSRRLAEAADTRRFRDVQTLTDALRLYEIDNAGLLPAGVDSSLKMIGTAGSGCNVACEWGGNTLTPEPACLDMSSELSPYLKELPQDPDVGSPANTWYGVRTVNGIVDVVACNVESGLASTIPGIGDGASLSPSVSPSPSASPSPSPTPSPSPSPTPPASPLSASYTVYTEWPTGYCVNFTITNTSGSATTSWLLTFTTNDSSIYDQWNGTLTSMPPNYTVANLAWNGTLPPGNSYSGMGYCANKTGASFLPTIISVVE